MHILCGIISPSVTMPNDATINAMKPEVRSSINIEMAAFTMTFIKRIVQRRRLPALRTGRMVLAYSCSFSEPKRVMKMESV